MYRGLKAASVIFLKSSLNRIVNFMVLNKLNSCEILQTLALTRFINLVKILWRLASLL